MKSVHRSFLLGKLTKSDINGVNRPTYCLDVTLLTYGCRTLPACPGHASATRSIPTMLSLRSNTSLSAIVISDTGRWMDESRSTTDSGKEQRCSSKVRPGACARVSGIERERKREREAERRDFHHGETNFFHALRRRVDRQSSRPPLKDHESATEVHRFILLST